MVAGLVSWGPDCHNAPTVHARTSYFAEWFEETIALYDERMTCGKKPEQRIWQGAEQLTEEQINNRAAQVSQVETSNIY